MITRKMKAACIGSTAVWGMVLAMAGPVQSATTTTNILHHQFTIPRGTTLELVAQSPLVDRPMMGCFDPDGNLFVADSSGSSENVQKQLREKPHRVVRLTDDNGDGRFDTSTVFAGHLMLPEGVLWHDNALYVSAPPVIWKLVDTDDDGIADRRTEWFNGGTLTGCANDLHGPYLGPDGWIYWCKGAFAQQTHQRPGRDPISDSAAHIFRQLPNGTMFDSLMSGGMDNPVEIAWTPEGEAIFTTTFFHHPQAGRRDALVHAIYGAVFPKIHGVLDGLKRTGDFLPPLTHLGPAVPVGLAFYEHNAFPNIIGQGDLLSTHFNMHRVQRHVLARQGSTFKTADTHLLSSDHPDFHPTDVLTDADGSLLIIDTGGWYKLCCPSSQLAKQDVLGAIYRLKPEPFHPPKDPRGKQIFSHMLPLKQMIIRLNDPRPVVQERAVALLSKQGEKAVPLLKTALDPKEFPVQFRRNAVWALTRIHLSSARNAVRMALEDPSPSVLQAAIHSAGIHLDARASSQLIRLLDHEDLHLRRAAASALAQIRPPAAVPALLQAAKDYEDRHLEHALIFALIEINDAEATRKGLKSSKPGSVRAALVALDQMKNTDLQPEEVLSYLDSSNSLLRETARWILDQHRNWAPHLVKYCNKLYAASDAEGLDYVADKFRSMLHDTEIQSWISRKLSDPGATQVSITWLLQNVAAGQPMDCPSAWIGSLHSLLQSANPEWQHLTLDLLHRHKLPHSLPSGFAETVEQLAGSNDMHVQSRTKAISVLVQMRNSVPAELFPVLMKQLEEGPLGARGISIETLAAAHLSEKQLRTLLPQLPNLNLTELPGLLASFSRYSWQKPGLAEMLVNALENTASLRSIPDDTLQRLTAKLPALQRQRLEKLLANVSPSTAEQSARMNALFRELPPANINRGHELFNSATTACISCHQIGYVGGKSGPDLSRIGSVRTQRDLLEAIVYPSASFVRSYEPVQVTTRSGEIHTGIMKQETAQTIRLLTGPDTQVMFDSQEIQSISPTDTSLMPEGYGEALNHQQLSDLVAFLQSLR